MERKLAFPFNGRSLAPAKGPADRRPAAVAEGYRPAIGLSWRGFLLWIAFWLALVLIPGLLGEARGQSALVLCSSVIAIGFAVREIVRPVRGESIASAKERLYHRLANVILVMLFMVLGTSAASDLLAWDTGTRMLTRSLVPAMGIIMLAASLPLSIRYLHRHWHDEDALADEFGSSDGYIRRSRVPIRAKAMLLTLAMSLLLVVHIIDFLSE